MPKNTGNFYSDIHLRTLKQLKENKIGDVVLMAANLFNNEKKNSKIIEIGSGYGQILYLLKKKGFKNLSGIDLNKEAVNFIKKNFKFIKIKHGSALNINVKKKYDIILCNGVLHHTSSLEKGLKEINKILKKNGKIFLGLYLFKNSFFDLFVRILRILSFLIPYEMMRIALTPFPIKYSDAILDHMYVPIIKLNSNNEILELFKKNRLILKKTKEFNPFIQKNTIFKRFLYNESFFRIYVLQRR